MGATVVLVYFRDAEAFIAHIGDSRAYLFREGRLIRLTKDHSITGILLEEGEISPEEAENHSTKGLLSCYVGMEDIVFPDIRVLQLKEGD